MSRLGQRLTQIRNNLLYSGFDYLLTATSSHLPDWLFGYKHHILFRRQVGDLGLGQQADAKVSTFEPEDKPELAKVIGWQESELDSRVSEGEVCFGVVEDDTLISYKWVRTKPMELGGMFTELDPGEHGFYLRTGYTIPSARRRGLSKLCSQRVFTYMEQHGRPILYTAVEATNIAPLEMHRKMGSEIAGETYYVSILGLRLVYRPRWPTPEARLERVKKEAKSDLA